MKIELFDLETGRAGLHARQIQQKRDEIGQAMRLIQDAFQIGRRRLDHAVGHVFDHGLQRRDWSAQFMADVRYHISAHLVGMLQFLGHLVEGDGQLADFVAAVRIDMHAHGVIAIGHGLGGVSHLTQRRGKPPGEEIGDAQSHG